MKRGILISQRDDIAYCYLRVFEDLKLRREEILKQLAECELNLKVTGSIIDELSKEMALERIENAKEETSGGEQKTEGK